MSLRTAILTTSPEISEEAVVDRSRAVRPKIAASFIRTSSNKSQISPLSARLRGEREGPAAERRGGEVGGAAPRDTGPPSPHPNPLRPRGRTRAERGCPTLCDPTRAGHHTPR